MTPEQKDKLKELIDNRVYTYYSYQWLVDGGWHSDDEEVECREAFDALNEFINEVL